MLDFFLNYRFSLDCAIMFVWLAFLAIPFVLSLFTNDKV